MDDWFVQVEGCGGDGGRSICQQRNRAAAGIERLNRNRYMLKQKMTTLPHQRKHYTINQCDFRFDLFFSFSFSFSF